MNLSQREMSTHLRQRSGIILLSILLPLFVQAQDNEISLRQLLDDAHTNLRRIEGNSYKISKMEINLIFEKSANTIVKLQGNRKYQIFGLGERSRVSTIGLRILDMNDKVLKICPTDFNKAEGDFTPPESGTYKFEFKVNEYFSNYNAARYLLIVSFR